MLIKKLILLLVFISSFAFASDRVAFVIGNGDYAKAPLKNAVKDATDISKVLRKNGFNVSQYLNYQSNQVEEVKSKLVASLKKDSIAVFYYAGHGIQVEGQNLFPSVDADMLSLPKIKNQSLKLDDLLSIINQVRPRASIIILDACRDNPFEPPVQAKGSLSSKGLARVAPPPATVVFYSTRPGSTASDGNNDNGLFTEQLLKILEEPNQPIEILFRKVANNVYKVSNGDQEPWVEGVIRDEIIIAQPQIIQEQVLATNNKEREKITNAVIPQKVTILPEASPLSIVLPPPNITLLAIDKTLETPEDKKQEQAQPILITSIDKQSALNKLRGINLDNIQDKTLYYCSEDTCDEYETKFKELLNAKNLPTLPNKIQKVSFCELNDSLTKCKNDYFDEGFGISPLTPLAIVASSLGGKFKHEGYQINKSIPSNGGGLSLEANSISYGGGFFRACYEVPGKIELMPSNIEFKFGASTCVQAFPPIPMYYKTEIDVLLFDEKNNEFIVKWNITKGSIGMFRSKSGIGKVSLN